MGFDIALALQNAVQVPRVAVREAPSPQDYDAGQQRIEHIALRVAGHNLLRGLQMGRYILPEVYHERQIILQADAGAVLQVVKGCHLRFAVETPPQRVDDEELTGCGVALARLCVAQFFR